MQKNINNRTLRKKMFLNQQKNFNSIFINI